MTYEYQCKTCSVITEKIQPGSAERLELISCPICGDDAGWIFSASSVLTQGMSKKPMDVAIGADSAKRWEMIHRQQAIRDKTRVESGKGGLEGITPESYRPISDAARAKRSAAMDALGKT